MFNAFEESGIMSRQESSDFSLTVISNEGVTDRSTNSHFTCLLGESIVLDSKYKWDVGIQQISFPRYIDTINYGNGENKINFRWWKGDKRLGSARITLPDYTCIMNGEDFLETIRKSPQFTNTRSLKISYETYRANVFIPRKRVRVRGEVEWRESTYEMRTVTRRSRESVFIDLNDLIELEWEQSSRKILIRLKPGENPVEATECKMRLKAAGGSRDRPNLGDLLGAKTSRKWANIVADMETTDSFTQPTNLLQNVSYLDVKCSLAGSNGMFSSGSLGIYPLA